MLGVLVRMVTTRRQGPLVKRDLRVACDRGTAANEGKPLKGMNRVARNASGVRETFGSYRGQATGNATNLKAGSGAQ